MHVRELTSLWPRTSRMLSSDSRAAKPNERPSFGKERGKETFVPALDRGRRNRENVRRGNRACTYLQHARIRSASRAACSSFSRETQKRSLCPSAVSSARLTLDRPFSHRSAIDRRLRMIHALRPNFSHRCFRLFRFHRDVIELLCYMHGTHIFRIDSVIEKEN